MSKVRSTMTLTRDWNPLGDGWALVIPDPAQLKAQCVDKFIRSDEVQSIILEVEIRAPYTEKTLSQLGYMHAAIWPVFYQYYRDQGIQVDSKEQMEKVRDDVKWAIKFIEERDDVPIYTRGSGGGPDNDYIKLKSFASASKNEMSEVIDQIIRLAADFGMICPGPEEYLEKHNAKEFI